MLIDDCIAFRELPPVGEPAGLRPERAATIGPRSGDEAAGALEALGAPAVQSGVGFTSQRGMNSFWTIRLPIVGVPGKPGSTAAWVEADNELVLQSIRSFRSLMRSCDERDRLRCCLLASSLRPRLGLLPDGFRGAVLPGRKTWVFPKPDLPERQPWSWKMNRSRPSPVAIYLLLILLSPAPVPDMAITVTG
jgi:hypothetical protein